MLPNYLIIGTGRAATTWVHECLSEHPNIFAAKDKEVNYFSKQYENGIDYYESKFKEAEGGDYLAIGEASPSYLSNENCPLRIYETIPNAKLIVILRNPIDRAYSQYLMFKEDHEDKTFEEAINNRPGLVTDGLYFKHIQHYMKYFDSEQILVLFFEDIQKDPKAFIQKIYRFLGVDDDYVPSVLRSPINMSIGGGIGKIVDNFKLRMIVDLIKKTPLDSAIRKLLYTRKNKQKAVMNSVTREQLRKYYSEDTMKLSNLYERNLSHWI